MTTQDALKQMVATAALQEVPEDSIIGIGTGSTVNYFIDALATIKHRIQGAVASSQATAERLRACHIPVVDVNAGPISVYIDGADECNAYGQLIKGGGGALTGEKILAACTQTFVCLIDESKYVTQLGTFPLPVEVIPLARSYVARALLRLGGNPVLREGFLSDYHNPILDVHHLPILKPVALEETLNQITGVVTHGLFAKRRADKILMATSQGVRTWQPEHIL